MRERLKSNGVNILSVSEQIDVLRSEGFDEILVLPSHLTPGEEFEYKILPFANYDVQILTPIFSLNCDTDFDRQAFKIIIDCFKTFNDEHLILIGHGSPHRHNPIYENLQRLADSLNLHVHIGVIESTDTPNFDDVLNRLNKYKVKEVLLAPMLFNGGVHLSKDIAGDDKNSWLSRLTDKGYSVRLSLNGLGSFKSFRQLFIEKIFLTKKAHSI